MLYKVNERNDISVNIVLPPTRRLLDRKRLSARCWILLISAMLFVIVILLSWYAWPNAGYRDVPHFLLHKNARVHRWHHLGFLERLKQE